MPGCGCLHLVGQQNGERLGEFGGDVEVVVDQEPLEERLVELAAEGVWGFEVGGFAVLNERQCFVQVGLGGLEVALEYFETSLGGGDGCGDAGLLGLEEIEGDRVGVVGFEELAAFGVELAEAAGLHFPFAFGRFAKGEEFVEDVVADLVGLFGGEADVGVGVRDGGFGVVDADGLLGAAGALLLAAQADEVLVDGAVAVLGMADYETAAAGAAEHGALQVVGVLALAFACGVVGGEQVLDLLPQLGADERFVLALVDVTSVADDAHVVGVAQQPVEVRDRERLGRCPRSGRGVEAPVRDFFEELTQRPVPGRVRLERPR